MKRRDSKIKGGLKLKNSGIDSFDAVMNMINCQGAPGATLIVLSYSSSSGFIFKLTIPPTAHHCVQFQGLSLTKTLTKTFNNDIYSLVLKLSVINDNEGNIKKPLEIDGRITKSKENAQAFMNEAKFQQEIFLETIVPSGNPICLGIADYSYLSSQTDASEFLDILIRITRIDSSSRAVLEYIKTNMETGDKLGIISMELADGYTELNELLDNHTHRNYEHFFSLSIAEIIILFAKLKYVNIDFHPKNILKNENNGDVRLIDFGRIANVNTSGDSGFPDDEKKDKVIGNYNRITSGNYENDRKAAIRVNIFKLYGSRITDDVIFENLHKIIKFYCCLDFAINSTYYNSNMRPQCMEFVKYIYGINSFDVNGLVINEKSKAQFLKISKKIIDIITPKMSSRNSMSRDAVDRQKRNGNFLIINKKISQYNVKYFPKEKKFKRHPDVFDLQNNAIIFFICCLCFYILKYKKFGGAITSSLFRKSINPASLSYSASKLLPNDKNDELKIKKYILKYVVKEIKKHNPCIKIDVTEIDANEIIPMSIEEYEEQIEKYKDSITNTKITADECEINSKIYIPDIDSILKIIMKKPKAITHKSQSVSELTRSQSVSEISRSPSELSRSQSVSEISRSLFEGGRRKTRKINNKL